MNTIILDIDRTLIHSVEKCVVKEEWKEHFETFEVDEYIVFLRPHVKEFINFLFNSKNNNHNFTVGIFTASSKEYAKSIVNYLFKEYNIFFLFSSGEYEESFDKYGRFKPIEYISEKIPEINSDKCIIIDDSSLIKKSNGEKCYKINPFVVCFDDVPKFNIISIDDTSLLNCMEWLKNKNKGNALASSIKDTTL